MAELIDQPLLRISGPLPHRAADLIDEGLRRSESVECFGFVPSEYRVLYACLAALPRTSFCEWGSGMGIGVGLAAMLGFDASGIEITPALADASRGLLRDFGIEATIATGSYFEIPSHADIYFTYSWPSQIRGIEEHFVATAPAHAKLLICYSAGDVRCKVRQP